MELSKLFFMITQGLMLCYLIMSGLIATTLFWQLPSNIQPTVVFTILCLCTFLLGYAQRQGFGTQAVQAFALLTTGCYAIFVSRLYLYRYNPAFFAATPEQIAAFNAHYVRVLNFVSGGYLKAFCSYPCLTHVLVHSFILLFAVVTMRFFFEELEQN